MSDTAEYALPQHVNGVGVEIEILDRIAPIILETVEGCVVDIGIGHTTQIIAPHAKRFNRKQYSVDSNEGKCEFAKRPEITHDNHIVCHMKSYAFMEEFNDTPSLVLLDGDHRAKVVLQEAKFFIERMAPNGVMFLHDTCPMEYAYVRKMETRNKEMDTYKARHELEKMEGIDVFTWRYGVGFTMVLKKDRRMPHFRW